MKDEEDNADACKGGRPGLQPPGELDIVEGGGQFSDIARIHLRCAKIPLRWQSTVKHDSHLDAKVLFCLSIKLQSE